MFSGIVETVGTILSVTRQQNHPSTSLTELSISSNQPLDDLSLGSSISVNGVCLTVTQLEKKCFHVTVVPETLRKTNLKQLAAQSQVNLERPIQVNGRLDGHYVQGHVDDTGEIVHLEPDGTEALIATIRIPPKLSPYIVNKGYIAIDGMSITVIDAQTNDFTVTFIPYTQKATIAKKYAIGQLVNLEVDMISKYIEKLTHSTILKNQLLCVS